MSCNTIKTIVCDGHGLVFRGVRFMTYAGIRAFLKKEGWVQHGERDYCPDCAKKPEYLY